MNIKEAKEQIQNSISIYFEKDKFGDYIIPTEKQRPVFLMGPPGIGKTAIMEQIAQDMGVGLISYSMTHHTRQSAIGLPIIEKKTYGGQEYTVSEYTMSEIIASVYEIMENSGFKEGILFLDEINCVSETLSPVMLQFLQYKIFGRHRVPDGWIVVTAGNPPEYNDSVREFDIVTWDRLKRIDVEPDYNVWKEYAYKVGMHPAIMTYLSIKNNNFYKVETTVDGKSFVTARGWDDLSKAIMLYERKGFTVDIKLISQYLQNKKISIDFAQYYNLFNQYDKDYEIDEIIEGKYTEKLKDKVKQAKFDERLALLSLLIDAISSKIKALIEEEEVLIEYRNSLLIYKNKAGKVVDEWTSLIEDNKNKLNNQDKANNLSTSQRKKYLQLVKLFESKMPLVKKYDTKAEVVKQLLTDYKKTSKKYNETGNQISKQLDNVFTFCEEVFEDGYEIIILVTELTINYHTAKFLGRFPCEAYFKHSKELLFYERQKEMILEIENLDLEIEELESPTTDEQ